MAEFDYLDFDLQIERASQGYRARVLDSPAGQATGEFALPFSDLELENFILRMSRTRRGIRRLGNPELEAARAFGGRLFEAVFSGEVRGCLRSSLDAASGQGRGLRLRLRFADSPELVDLPWEYLYSAPLNRFLCLSNSTPVVRYLDLPERVSPLPVQPPLRMLVMISGPRDYPPLDVEQEWQRLRAALQELEAAGLLVLERLPSATLSALQRRLRQTPCHILHFVGHGAFDEEAQDGLLLLEDEQGRGRAVSAQDLGILLHDHPSLRLVMLNSCEGARTSRVDPFAGAAQSLVQQGMPAVVAMQFEISDEAAVVIAHEFYAALAAGYPVDAALAEARKAAFTGGSSAEWGIPVLYMRAEDGRIFGVTPPSADAARAAIPVGATGVPPAGLPGARRTAYAPTADTPVRSRVAGPAAGWLAGRGPALRRWALPAAGIFALVALAVALARFLPPVLSPKAAGTRGAGNAALATGEATSSPAAVGASTTAPNGVGASPVAAQAQAGSTPGAPAADSSRAGQPLAQLIRTKPRVFSRTAWNNDVIPAADGVWAASKGGLVRWRADGTSTVFTAADGLPFTQVEALLAMPDGSFWAAGDYAAAHITPAGDGLGQIRAYGEAEGLPAGQFPTFMLDGDGSIWIASFYSSQPIYRFNGTVWRPPDLPSDDAVMKSVKPEITAMLRARDGTLWGGLSQDGILRLSGKSVTRFGPEQGVPAKAITCLLQDRAGVLWAAAGDGGLLRFVPETARWQAVELPVADQPVYWISELVDGSLWASGDNEILRSTDGGRGWAPVATSEDGLDSPRHVVQDKAGHVWVATQNGMAMYDGGQWHRWQRAGEPSDSKMARLIEGPDGNLWALPAYGGAPSVVDLTTGRAETVGELAQMRVYALAFVGDTTWAGTSSGLLRLQGGAKRLFTEADGLPPGEVYQLAATPHTLWIGTQGGLAAYDVNRGQITGTVEALTGRVVDALLLAPDGALWVGSHRDDEGSVLDRFAGKEYRRWTSGEAPFGPDRRSLRALAADEDGGIWVSASNGVQRWDGRTWAQWSGTEDAPTIDIDTFYAHDGAMWAAGYSGDGFYRWSKQDGWQRIRPLALTGWVADMLVTRDRALWLATSNGLVRYGP